MSAEATRPRTVASKVAERIYRAQRIGLTFGRVYLGIKANQFVALIYRFITETFTGDVIIKR